MISIEALYEADRRRISTGLAAQSVVASHFKLNAIPMMWDTGERTLDRYMFTSKLLFPSSIPTSFRRSVIVWAGLLADDWEEAVSYPYGCFDYHMFMLDMDDGYSEKQRRAIHGHPQAWRAFQVAMKILHSKMSEWQEEAKRLSEQFRFNTAIPSATGHDDDGSPSAFAE